MSGTKRYRLCPHLFWQRLCSLSDNLNGSAGSMECEGILHTVRHTESLQQLRYTGYLGVGDGDSKSHSAVPMLTLLYINCMISKLKCRGHVQKRMGHKQIVMDSPFFVSIMIFGTSICLNVVKGMTHKPSESRRDMLSDLPMFIERCLTLILSPCTVSYVLS